MTEQEKPSWMQNRTSEQLGDFIASLIEKRQPVLEAISLED